jgi:hypothetical protein
MKLIANNDLKTYILQNYDQVNIFATYLEIPASDIDYCLQHTSNKINNPLRDDVNPSLGFKYSTDKQTGEVKIKMYDFADSYYRGDCFDLVGIIRRFNVRNGIDFITICRDIIYTMDNADLHNNISSKIVVPIREVFTDIHIEVRLWNKYDIELWNSFGLPFKEISHIIFPLQKTFISNFNDYRYAENDPGYAWISGYYDGRTLYNLYFPYRTGKDKYRPRFKTNNKYYQLQCISDLRPADILIITKAMKERLLIKRLLPKIYTTHKIEVTAISSESIVLSDSFVLSLYDIYPTIITNFDFDYAGLRTSGEHKRNYGMLRFMLTNGKYATHNYGGKDLCEVYKNKGEGYCLLLLQEAYNYLINQLNLEI